MKPHIKKVNGMWRCAGAKGRSPKQAYSNYMFGLRYEVIFKSYDDRHAILFKGA